MKIIGADISRIQRTRGIKICHNMVEIFFLGGGGGRLKKDLSDLFKVYAENAEKSAPLGSTQANESFNNMVAAKAPKNRDYSGSESLCFRVGAAACVKSTGQNYLSEVYERAGIQQTVTKETKT